MVRRQQTRVKGTGYYREIVAEIVNGHDAKGRPKRQVRPVPGQGPPCQYDLRHLPPRDQ
jgi:hypothetical protein